ncbi:hypothetical protein [Methanopyrus kandleri]|uniref:Predicted membrane protein n=2 Tax=Methanopyrus kandleri TaxID=2320 RepID=Q8TYY2_METKA|nr:hypothetical protein [Methanopyrus kandleri]AAM01376.1 Predicted membrane protein [Methanopyrus kandleri AV19]HII70700.1 hypothetical protein [Methanopyrus kandleri]
MKLSLKSTILVMLGMCVAYSALVGSITIAQTGQSPGAPVGQPTEPTGQGKKPPVTISKLVIEVQATGKGAQKPRESDIGISGAKVEDVKISGSRAYAKIVASNVSLEEGFPLMVNAGWPFNMSECSYERISVSMELKANVNSAPETELSGVVVLADGRLVDADPKPARVNDNVPVWKIGVKDGRVTIDGRPYGPFPEIRYVMEYSRGAGGPGAGAEGGGAGGAAGGAGVGGAGGAGAGGAVTAGQYKAGESLFLIAAVVLAAVVGLYLVYRGLSK